MTKNDKGKDSADDALPEDGWTTNDGEFASEHTTVDPTLLKRLAALDGKAKTGAAGGKKPREKTITLDISDLLDVAEEAIESIEKNQPSQPPEDDAAALPEELEDPAAATEAFDAAELMAAMDAAPAPREEPVEAKDEASSSVPAQAETSGEEAPESGGPIMGGAAVLGGVTEDNSSSIGPALSGSSQVDTPKEPAPEESPLPELDPEFANEKTQIFVTAIDDEPTRAKLHIIQGGGQQKEYLLARDRLTIGRGTNNDILVPDISISRQHCEITRKSDGTFHLRDMQSGNGTKLNGARILDADLLGGDRIEIGSTVMEFVITGSGASRSPGERKINHHPSEAPARAAAAQKATQAIPNYSSGGVNATQTHYNIAPAPAQTSSNAWIWLALAAVGLLFLSLAIVVGAKIYVDTEAGRAGVSAKSSQEYYMEGLAHAKDREWDKAEEKFSFAVEIANDERALEIRKDATLKLEWVQQEKKHKKAVERGRALLKQGDYLEAITQLDTVRSGSPYYEEARTLIPEAREKYAGQLVDQAQKDYESKKYEQADRKLTLALITRPDYQPAVALRTKIDNLPRDSYERPASVARAAKKTRRPDKGGAAKPARTKPAATEPGSGGKTREEKVAAAPEDAPSGAPAVANFAPGLTMFRSGRYQEAVAYFDKIANTSDEDFNVRKARTLSMRIKSFETRFKEGNSAYAAGNHPAAVRALTNALAQDKSISGGYYAPAIKGKLAESHYQIARKAFSSGEFQRAGNNAKKVLRYKPNHDGNRQLVSQLEAKGRALYVDAQAAKKSDPKKAKRLCSTIITMLPAKSEVRKKAEKLSKEL